MCRQQKRVGGKSRQRVELLDSLMDEAVLEIPGLGLENSADSFLMAAD